MRIRLYRVKEQGHACYMSADGKIQLGVRDDYSHFSKLPLYVDVRVPLIEEQAAKQTVVAKLHLAA